MFQNSTTIPDSLEGILKLELDYFNSVVAISEKVVKQVENLPISVLTEMVNYRKDWIDKIQKLETHRKDYNLVATSQNEDEIMKKISKMASKLVKIDDKIYANLEQRKLQYIKESSALANESQYAHKQAQLEMTTGASSINIIQE